MIFINNVRKSFGDIKAIDQVSLNITDKTVFGLLGTNGAGKSTLLRMMAGIWKPDEGSIVVDTETVWDNPKAKEKFFYISDEQYFFPNASPDDMASFYKAQYHTFEEGKYQNYMEQFGLDRKRKIQTFSKGMKKQLSILLGLSANVKYLFCDETFDGLDPVMRQAVKSIFSNEMEARDFTPVIASHNLRELEDICDSIGLLHQGGVLLSRDLVDLKCNIHKIQCVLDEHTTAPFNDLFDIVSFRQYGRLVTIIVRGEKDLILGQFDSLHPVYLEALPLSLEEIFISETEGVGYDIKNLII